MQDLTGRLTPTHNDKPAPIVTSPSTTCGSLFTDAGGRRLLRARGPVALRSGRSAAARHPQRPRVPLGRRPDAEDDHHRQQPLDRDPDRRRRERLPDGLHVRREPVLHAARRRADGHRARLGRGARQASRSRTSTCRSTWSPARSRRARTAPPRSTRRSRTSRASPPAPRSCGRAQRPTCVRARTRGRSSRPTRPVRPTTTCWERAPHEEAASRSPRSRRSPPSPSPAPGRRRRNRQDAEAVLHDRRVPLHVGAARRPPGRPRRDRVARRPRPGRPAQGVQPRVGGRDQRQGPDRRARRRVRRPDDRVGPEHVPRVLRHPAVHDRERLLQEGQPGRRAGELSASRTRTGSRRSRSTPRWCRRSARTATSCSSRRTRPTRRSRCRTRCSTATSEPRSTRPSTSARRRSRTATARPGRSPTRPSSTTTTTIPASRSPPRRATRTTGRSGPPRRRTSRPSAAPSSTADPDDGARLRRERLGEPPPRHRAERGTGHRQRLLALGAEAGVAARRRLLGPHGRRRVGSRGQRRDLRLVAGDRRLGRRRGHEHQLAADRERLRARGQREVRRRTARIRTATSRASSTSRRARTSRPTRSAATSAPPSPATTARRASARRTASAASSLRGGARGPQPVRRPSRSEDDRPSSCGRGRSLAPWPRE